MANNALLFMHLEAPNGPIPGEGRLKEMVDWIDIDDWNWSVRSHSLHADRQAPQPSELTLGKLMDRSTTGMLLAMQRGTLLTAQLRMVEFSYEGFDLLVKLEGVRIMNFNVKTEVNERLVSVEEDWTFDYQKVEFNYRPNAKSGFRTVILNKLAETARPLLGGSRGAA